MGQREILRFLKENPEKWFSTKEISKCMEQNQGLICVSLYKLRNSREVIYKFRRRQNGGYLYRYKN